MTPEGASGGGENARNLVARGLQFAARSKEPGAFRGRQGTECCAGAFEICRLLGGPAVASAISLAREERMKFHGMNFQTIRVG